MLTNRLTTCSIVGLLALLPAIAPALAAGELTTLFTTPQERLLINANRYKHDEVRPQVVQDDPVPSPVQVLLQEEVTVEYRISGISLSGDGTHTVWINTNVYEDGEQLDDHSRIKVIVRDGVKVRITAPDGKHYFGTSGETISVSYMAAVEN
ncbi:MAG: hypothetical protein GY785_22540 [Gammaproteobacteria bacterium]|nr:hypothetical protein [Gammaproteobacteria bacterium]